MNLGESKTRCNGLTEFFSFNLPKPNNYSAKLFREQRLILLEIFSFPYVELKLSILEKHNLVL